MSKRTNPIFLERRGYRLRRVMDAAKLLPILGGALWAVPILWSSEPGQTVTTSRAMLYIFVVWIVLAGLGMILSFWLDDSAETERKEAP
ncbi:MAG: hypothetical protein JXR13_02855 [Thalassovita sp.]